MAVNDSRMVEFLLNVKNRNLDCSYGENAANLIKDYNCIKLFYCKYI